MRRTRGLLALSALVAAFLPAATSASAATLQAAKPPMISHPVDGSTVDQGELTVRGSISDQGDENVYAMYVVDASGSTAAAGYDCNGDGTHDADDDLNDDSSNGEILDCEIAGVIALNTSLGSIPGANSSIKVGLVAFGDYGSAADVAGQLSGDQPFTAPLSDDDAPDRDRTADIVQVAGSLDQGEVELFTRKYVGHGTNFTAALNAAFTELEKVQGRRVVFLLSDGYGSLNPEVMDRMDALDVDVRPFAVGRGSDRCVPGGALDRIGDRSGTPCTYTENPNGLSTALTETPQGIDRVEVILDAGAPVLADLDALGNFSAKMFASTGTHAVTVRVHRVGGTVTSATSTFTASPAGTAYTSIGDSYSAGEGIREYALLPGAARGCHQSEQGYSTRVGTAGYELPNKQAAVLKNVACSGAILKNLIGVEQNARGETHDVQLEAVDASTDLVSFTIGGNDMGFSDVLNHCATQSQCYEDGFVSLNSGRDLSLDAFLTARLRLLEPELGSLYRTLRSRSGDNATVVALNYPELFDDGHALRVGCKEAVVFGKGEREYLNGRIEDLRDAIARQATNAGIFATDVIDDFKGRRVCDGGVNDNGEWLVGHETVAGIAGDASFHPNVNGAAAYSRILVDFLSAESARGGPKTPSGLPRNPDPGAQAMRTQSMAMQSDAISSVAATAQGASTQSADELTADELAEVAALEFGLLDVTRLSALRDDQVCPTNRLGAGEQVVVTGHGFAAASQVSVLLKSASETDVRAFETAVTTDEAGSFTTSLIVPFDLASSDAVAADDDWQTALRLQADGRTVDGHPRRLSDVRAVDAASGSCTAAVAAAGDQAGLDGSPAPSAQRSGAPAHLLHLPVGPRIDVIPASRTNEIVTGSNRMLDVAVLSGPAFDARTLRHSQMRFGRADGGQTPMGSRIVDVNGDGLTDLVLRLMAQQTRLRCGDTRGTLVVDDPKHPAGTFTLSDRVTMTGCPK